MNYLLDTHILLWWVEDNRKLSDEFRSIIANPNNTIYTSIASYWEISIKQSIKKIRLKIPLDKLAEQSDAQILPVEIKHLLYLSKLPPLHNDPFDRLLIAQSKIEKLKLLSADKKIKVYFKQSQLKH